MRLKLKTGIDLQVHEAVCQDECFPDVNTVNSWHTHLSFAVLLLSVTREEIAVSNSGSRIVLSPCALSTGGNGGWLPPEQSAEPRRSLLGRMKENNEDRTFGCMYQTRKDLLTYLGARARRGLQEYLDR